jgi:uncharacterized protein
MADFSVPAHGAICWRELATHDLSDAEDFYREMFGWTLEQSKITQMQYTEIHQAGKAVGGMMAITNEWGPEPPPSHWTAYIAVNNADETVRNITENGGIVRHGPFDAPGVGRIAMASDPSGAHFAIIQFENPSA